MQVLQALLLQGTVLLIEDGLMEVKVTERLGEILRPMLRMRINDPSTSNRSRVQALRQKGPDTVAAAFFFVP